MKRPPRPTSLTLNLAPMVDVMMCLLIFFMLATKMVEQEHTRIDLPLAHKAEDAQRRSPAGRFVVNVRKGENKAGASAIYLLREEPFPLGEIVDRLTAAGRLDPRLTCLIRADRTVPYRDIEALLSGCTRAGVTNISLGALREQGGV